MTVIGCPAELAGAEARAMVELFDYVETAGIFPVSGGSLDQAHSFMSALRWWRNEVATWEAERMREANRRIGRN